MAFFSNDTNTDSDFSFSMEAYDKIDSIDIASLRKAISENFKLIDENLKALKSINKGC